MILMKEILNKLKKMNILIFKKILEVNPKSAKDPTVSARKSINQLVKLGFVKTGLRNYHRLSKEYLRAPTSAYRNKLFSLIVGEAANFAANVTNHDGRRHVDFITSTLMRIGSLNKKQIIGLMTIDPENHPKGFIDLDELNLASKNASKNSFFERKYNQVSYLCNVLNKLEDLTFHDSKLFFDEDARRLFQQENDNSLIPRNRYLDSKAKSILEEENKEKTGSKMKCMVTNIEYPTLISSHIKPSRKCDLDEKYDHKNLLLLSDEINGPFDRGDLSFDNEGKVLFADNVSKNFTEKFENKILNKVFIDEKRVFYLEWNRNNYFNKQNRHS
jgi:putative restriction endonuclease